MSRREAAIGRFLLPFVVIAAISVVKNLVGGWFAEDADLAFLGGITLVACLGGLVPGLLATALSIAASIAFFYRHVPHGGELAQLVVSNLEAVLICAICETLRRARVRADAATAEARKAGESLVAAQLDAHVLLEAKVAARTAQLAAANEERAKLQDAIARAQTMEAIGRLAGGIAHDFNNILTVINSTSEALLAELDADSPVREDVAEILDAGQRAAGLTGQLLTFSRKQVIHPLPVDLGALVRSMAPMLRRLVGEQIELAFNLDEAWTIADPSQLQQVVMNLVVNARDAIEHGGTITVETASETNSQGDVVASLRVQDTGKGMDEATRARIFEPFFTTKEHGKGTGLGLATVHGIAEQNHGSIAVESRVGHGTTFTFRLPHATPSSCTMRSVAPIDARGTEHVLLVEDDDAVRRVIAQSLRRRGFRVTESAHPGEALLVFENDGAKIDALVTDVRMPQMSGPKLAQRLHAMRPDLPVVYVSGYPEGEAGKEPIPEPIVRKPIVTDTLVGAIRQALSRKPTLRRPRVATA